MRGDQGHDKEYHTRRHNVQPTVNEKRVITLKFERFG